MKKLITLLLVIALLVPVCLTANADAAKKDFYAVTWSKSIDGFDHIKNLYTINISMMGENVKMNGLTYGSYTDAQVESMAKAMKTEMDKRAEGERYIHFFGPAKVLEALMEKEVSKSAMVMKPSATPNRLVSRLATISSNRCPSIPEVSICSTRSSSGDRKSLGL